MAGVLAALVLLSGCGGAGEGATQAPATAAATVPTTQASTTPATTAPPEARPPDVAEAAMRQAGAWFEQDVRLVSDEVVELDGVQCPVVEASRLWAGGGYTLAVLALDMENDRRYYQDAQGAWQSFQNDPWFACDDSPDGKYRIESFGMGMDGPSGAHALEHIRLVDLETCAVLWQDASYLWNTFLWSPGSRYAAVSRSGRTWTELLVLDTETLTAIGLPGLAQVLAYEGYDPEDSDLLPVEGPGEGNMAAFEVESWPDAHTVQVRFSWWAEVHCEPYDDESWQSFEQYGAYQYNVPTEAMTVLYTGTAGN